METRLLSAVVILSCVCVIETQIEMLWSQGLAEGKSTVKSGRTLGVRRLHVNLVRCALSLAQVI